MISKNKAMKMRLWQHFVYILNASSEIQYRGRNDDVVRAFYQLEEEGLGKTTLVITGSKGNSAKLASL